MTQPFLEARSITKRYEAVVALDNARLEVREGEVMGLVGDNGAGKSTLIKVISGVVAADSGRILFGGREVEIRSPSTALSLGIETVYQDLSLVDPMTAMQNVFLGREELLGHRVLRALRLLDDRRMKVRVREVLAELGAKIPSLDEPVQSLSGGQRQRSRRCTR